VIEIGPESLTQAERLDLAMTESDELGSTLRSLSSSLANAMTP